MLQAVPATWQRGRAGKTARMRRFVGRFGRSAFLGASPLLAALHLAPPDAAAQILGPPVAPTSHAQCQAWFAGTQGIYSSLRAEVEAARARARPFSVPIAEGGQDINWTTCGTRPGGFNPAIIAPQAALCRFSQARLEGQRACQQAVDRYQAAMRVERAPRDEFSGRLRASPPPTGARPPLDSLDPRRAATAAAAEGGLSLGSDLSQAALGQLAPNVARAMNALGFGAALADLSRAAGWADEARAWSGVMLGASVPFQPALPGILTGIAGSATGELHAQLGSLLEAGLRDFGLGGSTADAAAARFSGAAAIANRGADAVAARFAAGGSPTGEPAADAALAATLGVLRAVEAWQAGERQRRLVAHNQAVAAQQRAAQEAAARRATEEQARREAAAAAAAAAERQRQVAEMEARRRAWEAQEAARREAQREAEWIERESRLPPRNAPFLFPTPGVNWPMPMPPQRMAPPPPPPQSYDSRRCSWTGGPLPSRGTRATSPECS